MLQNSRVVAEVRKGLWLVFMEALHAVITPFHHFPCFICENGASWHRSCDAWTGVFFCHSLRRFLRAPTPPGNDAGRDVRDEGRGGGGF